MTIGEYVKQYRKSQGLSMQAFGEKCNLSRAYISILEKGINPTTGKPFAPTVETLNKIAEATGVSIDTLIPMLDGNQLVTLNDNSDNNTNNPPNKKVPKDLKKILEDEEVTLNGRMMSDEDKEKMMRIIEAAFYEAKEMNKRK